MQFKLPELGEGVHEGELVKWRVSAGDLVQYDQPLCEVMTDKATVEIPSVFAGKVAELHVKEGSIVQVGQLMISFEGSESSVPPVSSVDSKVTIVPVAVQQQVSLTGAAHAHHDIPSVLAAPSTRRLAREMGIDLSTLVGSGPHGRVLREDLIASRSATPCMAESRSGSGREKRVAFRGLRKKIAEKMRLSKDHAAHFTYVEEADATQLVLLRNQAKQVGSQKGVKVTYLPFVMKAMVAALKQYPILNSTLDEKTNELVFKYYYNIGLSIQTEEGLTAPVVKEVQSKSILQLAQEIEDLVNRARAQKLTREDFQEGTITLTNAGSIGGLFATPVINYPEVAIVGLNKIFRKPVVYCSPEKGGQEEIVIRDWTYFSISLDHRIVDGAIGAEFMKLFIHYIENPSLLVLE